MLLAIDIGNTNIVFGVFAGTELKADFRLHTQTNQTGDELDATVTSLLERRGIGLNDVDAVAVSNVVPAFGIAIEEMERHWQRPFLVLGPGVKTGVKIHYDDPRQVGADRIANAIAVKHLYGGPAIICDFGTATTIDGMDEKGDYLGGAIAPGIMVSLNALVATAARLPRIDFAAPPSVIGHNTQNSMQSGLVFGFAELVNGLVGKMRQEIGGNPKLILTGGLAGLMADLVHDVHAVDVHLTLNGLRIFYEMNQEN